MSSPDTAGSVSSILRYPVKSMLGEVLDEGMLEARGLAGDRTHALIDTETGKVVSVKRPRRWLGIFELAASGRPDGVSVRFPDGRCVDVEDPSLPRMLSEHLGRDVTIATVPPPDACFEEEWLKELKDGVDPYFDMPWRSEGEEDQLIDAGGFMGPAGNFFNFGAVHLVTTGSTRRLTELAPGSRFDPHRFRPNVVVDTPADGFVETEWQGRTLAIGDARLQVSFTVPRCVMTTLAQGDLPADPGVLRTITQHNAVDCFGVGTAYPCLGVYADVIEPGAFEVGQPVLVE